MCVFAYICVWVSSCICIGAAFDAFVDYTAQNVQQATQ